MKQGCHLPRPREQPALSSPLWGQGHLRRGFRPRQSWCYIPAPSGLPTSPDFSGPSVIGAQGNARPSGHVTIMRQWMSGPQQREGRIKVAAMACNLDRKVWRLVGGPRGAGMVLRTACCRPNYAPASARQRASGRCWHTGGSVRRRGGGVRGTAGDQGRAGETLQESGGRWRAFPGSGEQGSGK